MADVPKRVVERLTKSVKKFQSILKDARDRRDRSGVSEADTVSIVGDILEEVFGYDKYREITGEYAVGQGKSSRCDLAIKIDGNLRYLIEVKAIGHDLTQKHREQASEYAIKEDLQWAVLTNGIVWEIYHFRPSAPFRPDIICSLNLIELNPKEKDGQKKLFLLCKEGIKKTAIEDYHKRLQSVNSSVITAIILYDDEFVSMLRKKIRKLSQGLKIEDSEIEKILRDRVLRKDAIEGASSVKRQVVKVSNKKEG